MRITTTRKNRRSRSGAWTAMALLLTGTAFQLNSCGNFLRVFNPCGTIFAFCNARDVDGLFGNIPDFSLDPSCTIPFFGVDNPNAGGAGGAGGGGGGIGGGGGGIGGGGGGGGIGGGGGGIGGGGGGRGGGRSGICSNQEIFPTTPGPRP